MIPEPARLSVTIVAGRWGAGKSTVIDRTLGAAGPAPVVVCGGFGHDHGAAETVPTEAEVLHATKGCDCCALRNDLIELVADLLDRRTPPSHVLIEAPGGTDLATVAQTFLRDPVLRRRCAIRGLVTVVDGLAAGTALRSQDDLGLDAVDADGLAMSDLAVVNRLDRLVPPVADRTGWHLWSTVGSGQLQIDRPRRGSDPLPKRVLGTAGFDAARQAARLERSPADATLDGRTDAPLQRVRLHQPGELHRGRLDDWIGELQSALGSGLLRWTARLPVRGQRSDWLAQGVRTSVIVEDAPPREAAAAASVELIGRWGPEHDLAEGLARCRA